MKLNDRLNQCARTLNDGRLLSILSAGDVITQPVWLHYTIESDPIFVLKKTLQVKNRNRKKDVQLPFLNLLLTSLKPLIHGWGRAHLALQS